MTGCLLMLYPFLAMYFNGLQQVQSVDGYISEMQSLTEEKKQMLWKEAEAYNEKLRNNDVVMTDPFDEESVKLTSEEYMSCLKVSDTGIMAYLDIPSIKVHLPICYTTSEQVLSKAVGHLQGSSLPVGGDGTHCVLSAHTGLSGNRLFTDLDKMEVGDLFTVTIFDVPLYYQVYDIEIVLPEETDSLMIQDSKDLCTLVTCTPYGVNTHRLLVHGIRVPGAAMEEREVLATESRRITAQEAAVAAVASGGLVLAGGLIIQRKRKRK